MRQVADNGQWRQEEEEEDYKLCNDRRGDAATTNDSQIAHVKGHTPHANTCRGVHCLRRRLGQRFLFAASHDVWVSISPYIEQVLKPT